MRHRTHRSIRSRGRALVVCALSLWMASLPAPPVRAQSDADAPEPAPPPSFSERAERVGGIAVDLAVVRVFAIGRLAVGTAYFVAASPFSLATARVVESYEHLVLIPFEYAFLRPLGQL